MTGFLRRLKIRDQLLMITLLTVAVIFVIIIVTNEKMSGIISSNNAEYISDITSQTVNNVSRNADDISKLLLNIAYNPTVQQYLSEKDDMERYQISLDVEKLRINMRDMRSGIYDIIILGENGNNSGYLNGLDSIRSNIIKTLDGKSYPICAGIYQVMNSAVQVNYLVFGATIYDLEDRDFTRKKVGTVAAFIEPGSFGVGIESLSRSNKTGFYLLDRNYRIFATNADLTDPELMQVVDRYSRYENGTYSVGTGDRSLNVEVIGLEKIGGRMVSIVDRRVLLSESSQIRLWGLTVFLLALVFLAVPFVLILNNIVSPLSKLMNFMSEIKSGNLKFLKKRVNLEGYAEISTMAEEFNTMLDEMDNLTRRLIDTNTRLYESELMKRQSELSYLRSQINPHFLYNTLESIKSISNLKGVFEVRDMAKSLAHIFRYSIKGMETVKLSDELNVVKSYVMIQKIRFKDRIEAEYDISSEANGAMVIKMILQPIVENAVYHGLEPKRGKGRLSVKALVNEASDLVLWIRDDGVGMEEAVLESLRNRLNSENPAPLDTDASSIGMANVSSRIKLTYGKQYGLTINSSRGTGTEVIIRMPYRRDTDV